MEARSCRYCFVASFVFLFCVVWLGFVSFFFLRFFFSYVFFCLFVCLFLSSLVALAIP